MTENRPIKSSPAQTYAEAIVRFESQSQVWQSRVLPECLPKLLTHGEQTEHALVLFHGFTSCPEQFHVLGERLFDLGYNVFIPREPHHGLSDRLTKDMQYLKAEELAANGNAALDIACGLGKFVTVAGISGGGTIACWLAQNRPEVYFSVPIAPMLGLSFIPSSMTPLFECLLQIFPSFYLWWDPLNKEKSPYSPSYAYPEYPIHALSELLKLGVTVQAQAKSRPPVGKRLTMVINDHEPAVSNPEIQKIMGNWRRHAGMDLREVHFERALGLPHDIISPSTPGLDIETVYARLIEIITERRNELE